MAKVNLTDRLDLLQSVNFRVAAVKQLLSQAQMIEGFGGVALEHNLSAPVVATMNATPGFAQAVKNFPNQELFNVIPEHQSSVKQTMGLESLGVAQGETVGGICEGASRVADAISSALSDLDSTASDLQSQLRDAKTALSQADLPDEVVADMQVTTLSDTAFSESFSLLEQYLGDIQAFDSDELRANPEKIKDEVDGISAVVGDLGHTLGVAMDESGLSDAQKRDDYLASGGTIASKGLNKASLIYLIDRADGLCESLKTLSARREEICGALTAAAQDIPQSLNSDDITYGANEHVSLFCCYSTLTTKLIRETLTLVARVITTTDAVFEQLHDEAVMEEE